MKKCLMIRIAPSILEKGVLDFCALIIIAFDLHLITIKEVRVADLRPHGSAQRR